MGVSYMVDVAFFVLEFVTIDGEYDGSAGGAGILGVE